MNKKVFFFAFLFIVTVSPLRAEDARSGKGVFRRLLEVEGRGFVNVLALPAEIPGAFLREKEMHRKIWPVTLAPRLINNLIVRSASAANDIFFYHWTVPFTEDRTPMTAHFDLPEYPWQRE